MSDLIIKPETISNLDSIISECSGVLSKSGIRSIADSLAVLQGVKTLKEFFKQEEIKILIEDAQDNEAGFLTDRGPEAIWKHNNNPKKNYELKPYTYEQVLNAIIPLMLEGYALHGNEINIISKRGYRTQAGKYRKIINMTDGFMDNIATPAFKDGYAYLRCKAKWKIGDNIQTIGYSEDDECLLKIKHNPAKFDTVDKVIGLAYSKLYTRVLGRITGQFINEDFVDAPTDITDEVNAATEGEKSPFAQAAEEAAEKKKKKPARRGRKPKNQNAAKPKQSQKHKDVDKFFALIKAPKHLDAMKFFVAKGEFSEDEYKRIYDENDHEAARALTEKVLDYNPEATPDKQLSQAVQAFKEARENPDNAAAFDHLLKEHGLTTAHAGRIVANNETVEASNWLLKLAEYQSREKEQEPAPEDSEDSFDWGSVE